MMNGMVKYGVVLVFVSLFGLLNAQLLDNSQGNAFTEYPFFNTQFIKASKIKEIKGAYTFKKQGDIMRQTDYVYVFSFDSLGQLTRHYETAAGDIVSDTVVRYYTYDGSGNLLSLRINEKRGFMTTYYTYDDKNRVVKEEVWRDIDTLHSLLAPDIERSILWNSETMTYEEYPSQLRRKRYNSYGNQYVENTTYFDSLGYLSSTNDLYTITRDQYTTRYTYANKGWIDRMQVIHNIDSIPLSETAFTYDKYGNLTSKQEYKNGVFTTEYQVIYSGDTGMLSSVLIREVSSNFISIIRFSEPVFWE
jgi:hypothetical protein